MGDIIVGVDTMYAFPFKNNNALFLGIKELKEC